MTLPAGDVPQNKQRIYSIKRDCGRCVADVTSGQRADLQKSALRSTNITDVKSAKKSRLAQHVHEEGHKMCWKEMKVLQFEPNTNTHRKCKESAHISDTS
jgi:hypothetical protein